MDETRAEWLARRREFLGASEVAAVCGLDPSKTVLDVWASKKGLKTDAHSVAADMGNLFEKPLISYYERRNNRKTRNLGTVRRADHPWMAATPDAVTECGRNVQVKVVGDRMLQHWESARGHAVPIYVQAQTQWEMWVTGLQVSDIVACLGGTNYQEFELARSGAALGYIVEICSRFWHDNVLADRMPAIDGSESARAVLTARFRQVEPMGAAVPEFIAMAQRYRELARNIKAAETERDVIGNAMRLAIGDRVGLSWEGGKVTWKADKDGVRRLNVQIKGEPS